MKVCDLMELLADSEPDEDVHVALDLGGDVDSVSMHAVREAHGSCSGGVELVICEAFEVLECSDPALESALLGRTHLDICECCLKPLAAL